MPQITEVELIVPQGAVFPYEVTYVDGNNGDAAIDFTGLEARMHVRTSLDAAVPTFESDSAVDALWTLTPLIGKLKITIPATVTALWTGPRYVFDIELYDPADTAIVWRVVKGTMELDREVTHP